MKSKHVDLLEFLLQLFNFQRAEEIAWTEESEEAETKKESVEEQHQENVKAKDNEKEEEV